MVPADEDAYGIALGDHTTQNLVLNFNSEQAVTLQSTAFSADAEIKSFACRTGIGVLNSDDAEPFDPSGLPESVDGFNWKTEVSQAQVMANAIRRVIWAYVCKSNYEDTWGTFLDRRRHDLCRLPYPAVPGGSG